MVNRPLVVALSCAACCASLVMTTAQARAQVARDPAAADSSFARAKEAMRRGEIEAACQLFAESARLDPAPGAWLNLADCQVRAGRLASAAEAFREALATLPDGDDRVGYARERIARLEARVPKLAIVVDAKAPAGTTVSRDGVRLADASLGTPVPADPGAHELVVRSPGRRDALTKIFLAEGETRRITVAAGPEAPTVATGPESRPSRAVPYTLLGVGSAFVIGGAIFGGLVLDRASTARGHCTPGCDDVGYDAVLDGRWMSVTSPALLGVGLAAIAVGTWMLLAQPSSPKAVAWITGRTSF